MFFHNFEKMDICHNYNNISARKQKNCTYLGNYLGCECTHKNLESMYYHCKNYDTFEILNFRERAPCKLIIILISTI